MGRRAVIYSAKAQFVLAGLRAAVSGDSPPRLGMVSAKCKFAFGVGDVGLNRISAAFGASFLVGVVIVWFSMLFGRGVVVWRLWSRRCF